MAEWAPPPDSSSKRRADATNLLQVASKRQHLGDVNPGREYVEPRVYQQPSYGCEQQEQQQEQVRCGDTVHQRAGNRRLATDQQEGPDAAAEPGMGGGGVA